MQHFHPVLIPSISPRPGRAVRLRVARIGWALALIAVGLGPASVMAEDETPATTITLHNASGVLGIGRGEKARSKAGYGLLALYHEYRAYLQQADAQARGPSGFRSRNFMAPTAAGYVSIDTAAAGDPEALAADLEALGLEAAAVFGRMVSGYLPMSAIPALEALDSLQFAHPAYAMTHAGAVTSQGDAVIRADIARSTLGVDGTGVVVGALSNTFNCLGGAPAGVQSDDLPPAIAVLEEGPCGGQGLLGALPDEGRALAEVVHDVAPGAAIAFHTADGGQANFAQGIVDLANAGANVITDDIIYFAEPMFQDGVVARAVDQVKARGVSYFSAAQNDGRKSYESLFRGSGLLLGPSEAHDFDPGPGIDVCQRITLPVGQRLAVVFQWDQPFFSVSGVPGSNSDLDILLTDAACTTILNDNSGVESNVGRDPVEVVEFFNAGPATTFGLIILKFSDPAPGLMKTVLLDLSRLAQVAINEFDTQSPTSYGHLNALGGLGVGATRYRSTPAFGTTPPVPVIAAFSSAGGVPILFDTAGNRLAVPQIRQQPAIVAPSGVNTTFFHSTDVEGISDVDGDGFPNFFGTSAAAPHAAGVAALLKDLNPLASPDQIYGVLKAAAIDMDDPATPGFDTGFDFGSGFGLIRADVTFGPPPPPPPFEAEPARPRFTCRSAARCRVPIGCNLAQIAGNCGNRIEVLVPSRALRTAGELLARGPRQIQFGASITNVPPGRIGNVRLTLPKRIRNFVRKTRKQSIRGVMQIRSAGGIAIETRPIRIRLK